MADALSDEKKTALELMLEEWEADAPIDPLELGDSAMQNARLHAKWLRKRAYARLRLKQIETELKQLRREKHEFFTLGPTDETRARGWEFPSRGVIMKPELSVYMESDPDIVAKTLQLAFQFEIFDSIELVFQAIKARGFDIQRKLDEMKLRAGR